jgi:magnesium transporter
MRYFPKRYHPPGTRPGTLSRAGIAQPTPPRISLINFSDSEFEEVLDIPAEACHEYFDRPTTTWIHVQGDPNLETLTQLGAAFGLHELALEDIVNSGQRPKIELYDGQLFVILSHPVLDDDNASIEQVSLFLGSNFTVSFHAGTHDPFELVRKRLRNHSGRLRSSGATYLFYTLVDLVIDQSFPVLERFGTELEELEDALLEQPTKDTLHQLHKLKRDALLLRRMLWPQREVLNALIRDDDYPFEEEIKLYFRDCYDHTIQVMDLLETYRDMTTSMLDLYISSTSNRLNEIMRVLTVIATIFIPLTFIVGVYGMNFSNNSKSPWAMPELNSYYGYPITWGVMIAVAGGLLYLFKRNGWF